MQTPTTLWLTCAFIALGLEMLTGTLYLLVAATAMTAGALMSWLGYSQSSQLAAASLAGLLAWWLTSRWKRRQATGATHSADTPDLGLPVRIVRITAPGRARVFHRGAEWDASFDGPAPEAGSMATITGQDGNLLIISNPHSSNETK